MTAITTVRFIAVGALVLGSADLRATGSLGEPKGADTRVTVQVAGSGVDLLNTAIVHSQEPTATGMIQKSTETVELTGGLTGRVLYHVTSVFDFVK